MQYWRFSTRIRSEMENRPMLIGFHSTPNSVRIGIVLQRRPSHVSFPPNQNGTNAKGGLMRRKGVPEHTTLFVVACIWRRDALKCVSLRMRHDERSGILLKRWNVMAWLANSCFRTWVSCKTRRLLAYSLSHSAATIANVSRSSKGSLNLFYPCANIRQWR